MSIYSGKTVLVTGATGLIGSNLVDTLMKMGDVKVLAMARDMNKAKLTFTSYFKDPNFVFIMQDIVQPIKINDSIHYIFHAAGPIAGNIIQESPLNVIYPNIIGTQNCLEFLKKQDAEKKIKGRMIVFSSATVYGNRNNTDSRVTEDDTELADKLNSKNSAYSESKRMVEVLALAYSKQYSLDIVIARFGYVYGFTCCQPNTAFYQFINKAIKGEDLVFQNSGFGRRDNIFVSDAVEGVLIVGEKGKCGEAYNIASGADLNNFAAIDEMANSVAEVVNDIAGYMIRIVLPLDSKVIRSGGIIMDNSKLRQLGWRVSTNLKDGIMKTILPYMKSI